jgi:hypothetical protein
MFQLETPILELIARGAFLFVLFMVLFRIMPALRIIVSAGRAR